MLIRLLLMLFSGENEASRQSKQAALQRRQRTINRLKKEKQNKSKSGQP
jgi:hypothetical protein